MNEVVKTIMDHRSIREYLDKKLTEEQINILTDCAQMAPSSINGQQVSIVVIKDQERKAKLSELCGNQHFISEAPVFFVFCQDFYRAHLATQKNNVELKVTEKLEASIIGSIDVGLAMANTINAAESLGLGTVPIGGIRNNPEAVIELLNLPDYVFPLCGLVIGYPKNHSAKKPRLPRNAVVFEETYKHDLTDQIDQYDELMANYMLERTNGSSNRNWSLGVSRSYSKDNPRDLKNIMAKKGFKNN